MGFQQDSIELALFASDTVDITVGLGRGIGPDPRRGGPTGGRRGASRDDASDRSLCIIMPTIGVVDTAVLLAALRAELGPTRPDPGRRRVPARIPSRTRRRPRASSSPAARSSMAAIAILLFSGPLDYAFGVETGWRGVGPLAT